MAFSSYFSYVINIGRSTKSQRENDKQNSDMNDAIKSQENIQRETLKSTRESVNLLSQILSESHHDKAAVIESSRRAAKQYLVDYLTDAENNQG